MGSRAGRAAARERARPSARASRSRIARRARPLSRAGVATAPATRRSPRHTQAANHVLSARCGGLAGGRSASRDGRGHTPVAQTARRSRWLGWLGRLGCALARASGQPVRCTCAERRERRTVAEADRGGRQGTRASAGPRASQSGRRWRPRRERAAGEQRGPTRRARRWSESLIF